MRAKFVYESINDILKPKDPKTIMQSFGDDFNEIFKDVMMALIRKGYVLQPMKEAKKDYEDNEYSFMGKKIVAGDATWIHLKSKKMLDDMHTWFFNPEDDVDTDSTVHIIKLEDDTYHIEVSVNFRGHWRSRQTNDAPYFDDDVTVRNEDEVVPATLNLVNEAEKFLYTEILRLKNLKSY